MEPLYIRNHDRDSHIIHFGFYTAFLFLLCYTLYLLLVKEGVSIGVGATAVFISVLVWYMWRRFQQLREYSINGIIVDEKGITFSPSFYNQETFISWDMIRGFSTTTLQVKFSSITFLMIFLTNPKDFYSKSSAKILFGDDTAFYASLQDVNVDPKELTEKIMNYRNKLTEIYGSPSKHS